MKKDIKIYLLVIMILLLLSACRNDKTNDQDFIEKDTLIIGSETQSTGMNETEPTSIMEEESESKEETEANNKEKQVSNESTDIEKGEKMLDNTLFEREIEKIPSTELVKRMGIGWNLGNTLDATGGSGLSTEISWGNPYTTKEMIDTVKEAGFDILRLPTTWEKHLGPGPDYIIHEAWLDRVQEIVNCGFANDMYVILNLHHEEWHFPSYDNSERAEEILRKVWKQIANRFENYDEHLIFEGMNEPRMKGTEFEWNGGNEEGWDVINQLNNAFIETIRSSNGNNQDRHLMIPTYAASSDTRAWEKFEIPKDDKVIVSIHAYTPYDFALNIQGTNEWNLDNPNDTRDIDYLMNNIDSYFISKGIPVILGEFGAMNKDNIESRSAWSTYYIEKATDIGVPCIWWDNGAFTGQGELFGLINRRDLEWAYPEIVDALMKGLK